MIADLRPYPQYRNSGLSWAPHIPVHWAIARNGRLFAQRNETGFSDLPILEVSINTGVRIKAFDSAGTRKQRMADSAKYKRALQGDVAYNMMRMWQGAVGVAPVSGLVSPAYVVARPFKDTNAQYFVYLFRTDVYKQQINFASRGIVPDRNRLYWLDFKQLPSLVPPEAEQAAIVRSLTWASLKLERAIRLKKKIIAGLSDQKHAIINRVICHGMDSSSQVKDSGLIGFGDVPQHWEVTKLYRVTDPERKIMYGIVLPGPNVERGVYIVKGGNCEDGRLRPEFLSRTSTDIESRYERSRLRGSDIVYAIRGSIGAAQIVPDDLTGANLTQDAARIAAGPGIDPQWLLFAVRSRAFFQKLDAGSLGAAIRGINIRDLKRADVVVPPLIEQQAIGAFLERESSRLNEAIANIQLEIALLREYRTRLFSDIVTGKLDVRNAAPKLPDEAPSETAELDIAVSDESEAEEAVA